MDEDQQLDPELEEEEGLEGRPKEGELEDPDMDPEDLGLDEFEDDELE